MKRCWLHCILPQLSVWGVCWGGKWLVGRDVEGEWGFTHVIFNLMISNWICIPPAVSNQMRRWSSVWISGNFVKFLVGLQSLALLATCFFPSSSSAVFCCQLWVIFFASAKPHCVPFCFLIFSDCELAHTVIVVLDRLSGLVILSWVASIADTWSCPLGCLFQVSLLEKSASPGCRFRKLKINCSQPC